MEVDGDETHKNDEMASEIDTLQEAVRLRDELLDEMQRMISKKKEETDHLLQEARRISDDQMKILRLQLQEKDKQVKLLQDMVNDMDSSHRISSDLHDIHGSETQRDRPFVDDFLLKVLGERDELTDKLHDLHNELAETKARLGTAELEKERLLVDFRSSLPKTHSIASDHSNNASPSRPVKPKRNRTSESDDLIRKLNARVSQLESELAEHQRVGSRLKRKETQRMREAERLKTEMDALANERGKLLHDLRKTRDENTHLALVQTLEDQLKEHESQRHELETKFHRTKHENEESAATIRSLQRKVMEYEQHDPVIENKKLHEKIATLSDAVMARDERLQNLQEKHDHLQQQYLELLEQSRSLETKAAKLTALESKQDAMATEYELSKQALKSERSQNEVMSIELKTLDQELKEFQKRNQQLTADLANKDGSIEELMAEIGHLNEEADNYYRQKEEFERMSSLSASRAKELSDRESYCEKILHRFKEEQKRRRALHNQLMEIQGNIRVHCRIRPVLRHEIGKKDAQVIVEKADLQTIVAEIKPGEEREFEFDRVHDAEANNENIFLELQTLITSFIDGFNVCIMAYGQTGSGKTHTMLGQGSESQSLRKKDGIVFRAVDEVFQLLDERATEYDYTITVSVAEIYNNRIRDLLGDDFEAAHEVIVGTSGDADVPTLRLETPEDADDVLELVNRGMRFRAERTTDLNERSSRSHLIITLICTTISKLDGKHHISRLHMVDLAGSENNKMAKQSGDGLREASNINKSLSALGDVMAALDLRKAQPKRHIPYRNSKLTLMLKDAIGGNAKTLLLVCVNPTMAVAAETTNTLRFGVRARSVQKGQISFAK